MAALYCWDIDCVTDGVFTHWAELEPVQCPNDAGHTLTGVSPSISAHLDLHMNDGAGRVYKMTIDQNGTWVPTQVAGPSPV